MHFQTSTRTMRILYSMGVCDYEWLVLSCMPFFTLAFIFPSQFSIQRLESGQPKCVFPRRFGAGTRLYLQLHKEIFKIHSDIYDVLDPPRERDPKCGYTYLFWRALGYKLITYVEANSCSVRYVRKRASTYVFWCLPMLFSLFIFFLLLLFLYMGCIHMIFL